MSRGIDPLALPFDRFLNLVQYAIISNYDTVTFAVDAEKYAVHTRDLTLLLTKGKPAAGEPPAWWDGDDEASRSGLIAARQLGFRVDVN